MKLFLSFLLLIALAIGVRYICIKLLPWAVPSGRFKTTAVSWLGGLVGSLGDRFSWQLGPKVVEVHLIAAIIGAAFFLLGYGLAPFIKIFLGRIPKDR